MRRNGIKEVGKRIRKLRLGMGLTQKEFGALIEKSESQVGAYENGTTGITLDIFFRIAEAAKVKPEELIREKSDEEKTKRNWDAELRIYNVEDRKSVMAILAVNGYDVGQHKKKLTPTGKTLSYYVHVVDREDNAATSK